MLFQLCRLVNRLVLEDMEVPHDEVDVCCNPPGAAAGSSELLHKSHFDTSQVQRKFITNMANGGAAVSAVSSHSNLMWSVWQCRSDVEDAGQLLLVVTRIVSSGPRTGEQHLL